MSVKNAAMVVASYLSSLSGGRPAGIQLYRRQWPYYSSFIQYQQVPCYVIRSVGGARDACLSFYDSLTIGEEKEGEALCPFGVRCQFYCIQFQGETAVFLVHSGVDLAAISPASLHCLSRKNKKKIKRGLSKAARPIQERIAQGFFANAETAFKALITGATATAIQAYSHAMLTPVQGVLQSSDRGVRSDV